MRTRSSPRTLSSLSKDHHELLSVLIAHGVSFLVVGGYATGIYTEPRATKDLDVFVRSDGENAQRLFRALAAFGAPLAGLTPADFEDGTSFFQIGAAPDRVDILQRLSGIDFDESWANHVTLRVSGGMEIPVISADDLIRNKLAAARDQDLIDVKKIRASAIGKLTQDKKL